MDISWTLPWINGFWNDFSQMLTYFLMKCHMEKTNVGCDRRLDPDIQKNIITLYYIIISTTVKSGFVYITSTCPCTNITTSRSYLIIFDQTCVFFRTVILPWIGVKWHVPMLTLIRQSVMCKNHIYTILFSENNINMSYTELKGLYHLRETIGSGSVM